jgi:hypothetical protein
MMSFKQVIMGAVEGGLDPYHLCQSCYHPIIYGNHLMTGILSISGDLVHK